MKRAASVPLASLSSRPVSVQRCSLLLGVILIAALAPAVAQSKVINLPPATNSQNKEMTVEDVIKLTKAGLSDDVIIQQIKKKGRPSDLSTDQLLRLKTAHVSDRVIKAMTEVGSADPNASGDIGMTTPNKNIAPTTSQADMNGVAHSATVTQSTWNDLHFGSSVAEVRQLLSKQHMELQRANDCAQPSYCEGQWIVRPDWKLELPATQTFWFTVRLFFSNDQLELVHLLLREDESLDRYVAVTSIEDQLIAKYGMPATVAGTCNKVDATAFVDASEMDCNTVWKAENQNVKFGWFYTAQKIAGRRLTLEISYTRLRSGL